MAWKKLVSVNNWGVTLYFLGKVPAHYSSLDSLDIPPNVENVEVKWPDGQVTLETIMIRKENVEVHDHGNRYTVTDRIPYFVKDVNGLKVDIDLIGLMIRDDQFRTFGDSARDVKGKLA